MNTQRDTDYQRQDELLHSALQAVRRCVDRDNADISSVAVEHLKMVTKISDRLIATRQLLPDDESTLRMILSECEKRGHCS